MILSETPNVPAMLDLKTMSATTQADCLAYQRTDGRFKSRLGFIAARVRSLVSVLP